MNKPARAKIFILGFCFLFILSSLVLANFSASISEFNLGGTNKNPGDSESESFDLSNSFADYNLSNFDFSFNANSSMFNNPVGQSDFTLNFPSMLGNGSETASASLDFTIPDGMSAVDEDLEETDFVVGTINISADATDINGSSMSVSLDLIEVKLQVENNIQVSGVEMDVDGETENVASGSTKDLEEGDRMQLAIEFENKFDSTSFDSGDVDIELFIDGEKEDDGDSSEDVDGGEKGTIDVSFKFDDQDTYEVKVELVGIDEFGGRHADTFEFEVEVKEETSSGSTSTNNDPDSDGDDVPDNLDLCPNTLRACSVDEAGCAIDNDGDGICNAMDRYPNGEDEKEEEKQQTFRSNNEEDEPEEDEKKEPTKQNGNEDAEDKEAGGSVASFILGLVIGIFGTVIFTMLTKV